MKKRDLRTTRTPCSVTSMIGCANLKNAEQIAFLLIARSASTIFTAKGRFFRSFSIFGSLSPFSIFKTHLGSSRSQLAIDAWIDSGIEQKRTYTQAKRNFDGGRSAVDSLWGKTPRSTSLWPLARRGMGSHFAFKSIGESAANTGASVTIVALSA